MNSASQRWTVLRELFLHPLVLAVLALKLAAAAWLAGSPLRNWFAPFVGYFATQGFQDPWAHFMALGQLKAFPYPPGMLYIFALPRWMAGAWVAPGSGAELLLMRLPLLGADLLILAVLGLWFRDRLGIVRLGWWCSPVVFYVSYVHGQLDLVPTAFFMGALFLLERGRYMAAFLVYGLALSTKNHLWIALPFLLIYLRGRLSWMRLAGLSLLAAAVAVGLALPYALRPAYRQMVLGAEEQSWIFSLALPMGKFGVSLLLGPAALLLLLARFATYPRHNWDLTLLYLGLSFGVFVLLVPPMPGWYLWSLPFVIYYFCRFRQSPGVLLLAFSSAYWAYFVLGSRSDLAEVLFNLAPGFRWPAWASAWFGPGIRPVIDSLYFTLLQSSLAAGLFLMYTRGVRSNDVYAFHAGPVMIGIAGDSGAGKDTLALALTRLFGERDVIRLAGDDYHRWERGDPHWKLLTHLDPRSNRLHQQLEHAVALRQGRAVFKSEYDHSTGRFTQQREVDARKNIIVQGLHTFLLERMRQVFDLKIFLDPDERLRVFWKLQRDGAERGHSRTAVLKALRRREADRSRAILPQREHADLLFRLMPLRAAELKRLERQPELALEIVANNSFDLESLAAALESLPGVKTALDYSHGNSRVHLRVQGGPLEAAELDRLALGLVPNLGDLVGTQPEFQDGWVGLMSLCVLYCLSQSLQWRGGLNRVPAL
jgi:uridine kinase